jgi:signal transduction histidine kinase
LASIDAGQAGVSPRDVDVRGLLEDSIGQVEAEARAAGNRIALRVDAAAGRAFTDGGKLALCVSAVLANAVKFTSDGLIAVSAERSVRAGGDWLTISVSDTGCGIAADDLSRVFMPFTQIDGTATRAKGGMGLGLAVAQRMAAAIGGEVTAESLIGKGSTFTVAAPMRLTHAAARAAA